MNVLNSEDDNRPGPDSCKTAGGNAGRIYSICALLQFGRSERQARSLPSDNGGSFSADFGPFSGFEN